MRHEHNTDRTIIPEVIIRANNNKETLLPIKMVRDENEKSIKNEIQRTSGIVSCLFYIWYISKVFDFLSVFKRTFDLEIRTHISCVLIMKKSFFLFSCVIPILVSKVHVFKSFPYSYTIKPSIYSRNEVKISFTFVRFYLSNISCNKINRLNVKKSSWNTKSE